MLRHAVTLTFNPLTLNVYSVPQGRMQKARLGGRGLGGEEGSRRRRRWEQYGMGESPPPSRLGVWCSPNSFS